MSKEQLNVMEELWSLLRQHGGNDRNVLFIPEQDQLDEARGEGDAVQNLVIENEEELALIPMPPGEPAYPYQHLLPDNGEGNIAEGILPNNQNPVEEESPSQDSDLGEEAKIAEEAAMVYTPKASEEQNVGDDQPLPLPEKSEASDDAEDMQGANPVSLVIIDSDAPDALATPEN